MGAREYETLTNLLYYDTISYNDQGEFVPLPADVRLSDPLIFVIIAHNVTPGKKRNTRWPYDFNTDGNIYPESWPMGDPVVSSRRKVNPIKSQFPTPPKSSRSIFFFRRAT